jgi:hypothetical protein
VKRDRQHPKRQRDEDVILQCGEQHQRHRWLGCVKRLERRAAEHAAINDRRAKQQSELGRGVDAPAPDARAERVEVFGMFPHEQRLRLAVAALLFQIIADRRAAVVPDKRRRAEADLVSGLLQSPADVHVIARSAVDGIESIDGYERAFEERHIATGNVFCLAVGQHHMRRAAG